MRYVIYICTTLKPIISIALVIICLIQSGGMLLIYHVQQYTAKLEMREILDKKSTRFQKLNISIDEFHQYKINAHEILLDNNLYDIKSVKINGDKVELLVLHDAKEKSILDCIKKTASRSTEQNKKFPNHLLKLISLVYYIQKADFNNITQQKPKNNILFQSKIFFSQTSEIPYPPPKLV